MSDDPNSIGVIIPTPAPEQPTYGGTAHVVTQTGEILQGTYGVGGSVYVPSVDKTFVPENS